MVNNAAITRKYIAPKHNRCNFIGNYHVVALWVGTVDGQRGSDVTFKDELCVVCYSKKKRTLRARFLCPLALQLEIIQYKIGHTAK